MKKTLLILGLLFAINIHIFAQCNSSEDYAILYLLYNNTGGDNWVDNTNWDVSAVPPNVPANLDMSTWHGITCDGNRVTKVHLVTNNLTGTIPPQLGKLSQLTHLTLAPNNLTGSIPSQLGNLTKLEYLSLTSNELTGSIPVQLGNLVNLESLQLGSNQLTGAIPDALGNLNQLISLNFASNQLTGNIPASLGGLSALKFLEIRGNQLTGIIPNDLGNLSLLRRLYLSNNQLSGNIPSSLGNLSNLEWLYLDNNQFTGNIPSELGNLTNLKTLYLNKNQLTGSIPTNFNQLSQLTQFSIRKNQLAGCYDAALKDGASVLCNFSNGHIADGNNFIANWDNFCNNDEGVCGGACNNADDYAALYALYNSTDGDNWNNNTNWDVSAVPPNVPANLDMGSWYGIICDGGRVTEVGLGTNNLAGIIPVGLEDLTNLERLYLNSNQLTSNIPPQLGNLGSLKTLSLYDNQLMGNIPAQLGNLTNLKTLFISGTQLTGSIPSELGNLANLETLILAENQLTGSIPVSFNQLSQLTQFTIRDNQLSGCYDPALKGGASVLCNFSNIQISTDNNFDANWDDFCNNDEGVCVVACNNADDYAALYALYNSTDGDNWTDNSNWDVSAVPPNVPANLDMSTWFGITCDGSKVTEVFLSANNLTGTLPADLGNLGNLEVLALHENQLSGSIPSSLGNLSKLEILALFDNQLSGSIPSSLGNLSNMVLLGLHENQLSGSIPSSLGNLSNLEELVLYANQLTGSIPTSLGNIPFLNYLVLSDNELSGSIPASLGNLPFLDYINLSDNQLSGSIPASLGNISILYNLNLSDNQLSGSIPASFNQLQELTDLRLSDNQLSGCYDLVLKGGVSILCDFSNEDISDGNNFDASWEDFCNNDEGICCGFNPSNWVDGELAEYIIIANEDLEMTKSTVVEGGIAVTNASEVNIEDDTHIQTFLMSEEVSIDGTSTVADYIDANPNLQLPPFMANTFFDGNNVMVMNGQTVTLTGNHYGYITVMSGGTLNFDNPNVFVQNITTKSQAKVNFLQASHIMIRRRVNIGMLNVINENEEDVVIYVGNSFKVAQGSVVNAGVFAQGKIKVNDSGSSIATYMYGTFISKDEVSSQDNVTWAWSPICVEMENQNLQQLPNFGEEEMVASSKNITLYPNPTSGNFSITAEAFMQQKVDVKIYNALGQTVWQLHLDKLEEAIIPVDLSGSQFENGIYHISIMTGDIVETKTLVLNK